MVGGAPTPSLVEETETVEIQVPERPLSPVERRTFDYDALDAVMAVVDEAVRNTRRALARLTHPTS